MAEVHLTLRALQDIDWIDVYSTEHWGEEVAARYLADLHGGLKRLEASTGMLLARAHHSLRLRFLQVRKHVLVCDVVGDRVYVLTLVYGGMDLPNRIAELEPRLVIEAERLHRRLGARDT